jgi:transcriptional regulator with XRE-family HTH domain
MEKSIYSREYGVFLELLREAREDALLTQQALAEKLGTTQTQISKCERGERRLDVIELREWCSVLSIEMHDFIKKLEMWLG